MRVIVMSDSHGSFDRVKRIVDSTKDTAAMYIHLGDGLEEFEDVHLLYPQLHFVAVKGNNDWGSMEKKTKQLVCGGKRVLITHGDLYRVKFGTDDFERSAREEHVDIALYGHTHCACVEYLDGLYLINPGSVLDGHVTPCSYLCLDITASGVVPVIREL